eukprot:4335295-Alexandrium_andersonii.AAC.1
MSASLVGSEMCIRDSPAPTGAETHHSASRRILAAATVTSFFHTNLCRLPVSYTHLTLPTICSV